MFKIYNKTHFKITATTFHWMLAALVPEIALLLYNINSEPHSLRLLKTFRPFSFLVLVSSELARFFYESEYTVILRAWLIQLHQQLQPRGSCNANS